MNNTKVRKMTQEVLQPFFDEIVDMSCRIFLSIYENLPGNMPDDEKNKIVLGIIERQRDALISSVKSGIPEDFEKQLKEAFNGRS